MSISSEPAAEAKPNGAVPATVTLEVPDDLSDDAKRKLRQQVFDAVREIGARYVLENDTPTVRTAGDLLKQDAAGWPSTILLPTPSGAAVSVSMIVNGSIAAARAERQVAAEFFRRIAQHLKDRASDDAEPSDAAERVTKRDDINTWYAGALFDAGVLITWDETANGLPYNRENFVALASRGGYGDDMVTPFLSGVLYRFRQVTRPLLKELDAEGEA